MDQTNSVESLLKKWVPVYKNDNDIAPAEVIFNFFKLFDKLFDKHPLSAMMMGSEDINKKDNLVLILNSWKSEWNKDGVQVPVRKTEDLPVLVFRPEKLRHEFMDHNFDPNIHCITDKKLKIPSSYHVDDLDYAWISTVNEERECLDQVLVEDWMLEFVIDTLEYLAYIKMHEKIKEIEVQGLEFDENARCDICLSFEGEDGNELVFCDGCLLCVHQACYGIIQIPEGSWMCRQCEAGIKSTTPCSLCPNTGGAMKLSDDGERWCHVSCALWVPEVGFRSIELMEPIIRLDNIPQARRNLLCSICRSRYGAPIQCSNKKCKIAFHVTCAFQSNLVMRQELVDKDVRLMGLCLKHSRKENPNISSASVSSSCDGTLIKTFSSSKLVMDSNQCYNNLPPPSVVSRKQKLLDLENNFHKLVDENCLSVWINGNRPKKHNCSPFQNLSDIARIPSDIRSSILVYWRLKRRSNFNQPLINPVPLTWRESVDEISATTKEALVQAERVASDMEAFDAFRRIRFGLDRARLVVDMVLQRERRKLALIKRIWRISELQLNVLLNTEPNHPTDTFVCSAHMGESIYDNWELFKSYPIVGSQQSIDLEDPSCKSFSQGKNVIKKNGPDWTTERGKIKTKAHDKRDNKSNAVLILKENLVVTANMKHRLRSALTLVTNNYYFPGNDTHPIDMDQKQKLKTNPIFGVSSKKVQRCKSQLSPAFTCNYSSPENKLDPNAFPVVALSPISPKSPLRYCNGIMNISSNESPPKMARRSVYLDNTESCENNPVDRFPVLTKLAIVNLSTKLL